MTRGHTPREDKPATRRDRKPPSPAPTLGQLRRSCCWMWIYCTGCPHNAPAALAPLIIRWGENASSDKLRANARCSRCGGKGAALQYPGWGNSQIGVRPFPN